jgi:acetyl-CoA synthetase
LLNADHAKTYFAGCPPGPDGQVLRRHGDKFARLGAGFFRAQGRVDDTMNLGGIKVGSLELERVLATHEAVSACAAVGVQLGGEGVEHLVVYAVVKGSADPAKLKVELSRLLGLKLNPLFKIHEVIVTQELPRTASGKLMRRSLQARYREEHAERA